MVGARVAFAQDEMKQPRSSPSAERNAALHALKIAIVQGATGRYEHLVAVAVKAGATDDDVDAAAHQALQALLAGAEQLLTARELAHEWAAVHFRH